MAAIHAINERLKSGDVPVGDVANVLRVMGRLAGLDPHHELVEEMFKCMRENLDQSDFARLEPLLSDIVARYDKEYQGDEDSEDD